MSQTVISLQKSSKFTKRTSSFFSLPILVLLGLTLKKLSTISSSRQFFDFSAAQDSVKIHTQCSHFF